MNNGNNYTYTNELAFASSHFRLKCFYSYNALIKMKVFQPYSYKT